MQIDTFFSGTGGVILGSAITAAITYYFQRRQLEAQKKASEEMRKLVAESIGKFEAHSGKAVQSLEAIARRQPGGSGSVAPK